jgi:hypothetical protein
VTHRRCPVSARRIPSANDPFYSAGKRTEAELVEALAEDETKQGRPHTSREREAFARGFFGEEYRAEIGRLMTLDVEPPEDADEDRS